MTTSRDKAPVWGLVLAGGRSARMGVDKCALDLHGEPQARHAYSLLRELLPETRVSARPEQRELPALAGLPLIEDRYEEIGPVSGVLSAMEAHPGVAWLTLACDLPLVDARGVRALLDGRDSARLATAYMATDGYFEPLFAMYEPEMEPWLRERLGRGRYSLREALADADVRLLCPPEDQMLMNVNTPEDLAEARRAIARMSGAAMRTVCVQYFAVLREEAGVSGEEWSTSAETMAELYDELSARHGFGLPRARLKVVVNEEFDQWTRPVREGDVVVFIPPVAGG